MNFYIEAYGRETYTAAGRGDVAVIIDALRASVTITTALAHSADRVIPLASVQEARRFLGRDGYLVAGERDGVKIEEFDLGNSPTELLRYRKSLAGMVLVLTTSNGTRCVQRAEGASAILIGSLVNLSSVTEMCCTFATRWNKSVSFILAGRHNTLAIEDLYVAALMCCRLRKVGGRCLHQLDIFHLLDQDPVDLLRNSLTGRHLLSLGCEEDVRFCAQIDMFDLVPWFDGQGFVV